MKLRSLSLPLFLALALASASCSKGTGANTTSAPPAAEQAGAHASNEAKPGSYEDWCGEHQVPESQCTRCNPALIPAFKATKDWCAEHSLPESQCTKCNPELKITRPAKGI
jgi:hypothetical protein